MVLMKKALTALLFTLILAACGTQAGEDIPSATPIVLSTLTGEPTDLPASEEANPEEESSSEEGETQEPMQGPDCLGPDVNEIGLSIASTFGVTIYEEVMTWFCNGAEFEDILLALQSEQQSDASAEEMLQMLADGFTWDEIWLLVGITG